MGDYVIVWLKYVLAASTVRCEVFRYVKSKYIYTNIFVTFYYYTDILKYTLIKNNYCKLKC